MMRLSAIGKALLVVWAASLLLAGPRYAAAVTFVPLANGVPNPVGIGCCTVNNTLQLVVSVHFATGLPGNFEQVLLNGTHSPLGAVSGIQNEVKIATFGNTVYFSGNNIVQPPAVGRMLCDGTSPQVPWALLPGAGITQVTGLYVDQVGVAGGDLIAVTGAGAVYRINRNTGIATKLAQLPPAPGSVYEGVATAPNNPALYGPWAGKILVTEERTTDGQIFAINPTTGSFAGFTITGLADIEDIKLVPANADFFGVDFQSQRVWRVPASQFATFVGDFVVAQELPGILYDVKWNGTTFVATNIGQVPQWEQIVFCPVPTAANRCPLTQGFWKNHASAWPVTSLAIGGKVYTQSQLITILQTSPAGGNAALILAHQLIAAKLNIANGSNAVPVLSTIAAADALLAAAGGTLPAVFVPASSTLGQQMVALATILDQYNNGAFTPGCTP